MQSNDHDFYEISAAEEFFFYFYFHGLISKRFSLASANRKQDGKGGKTAPQKNKK